MELNLAQAKQLLELFGGYDASITLTEGDGHSGEGLYAHFTEYPEEGTVLLAPEGVKVSE